MLNPFEQKIEDEWADFQRSHADECYPNIMLLGASGVGKSSLINRVFGGEPASVSHTAPETKGYANVYRGADYESTVNLIDTAGYELGQGDTYYENIRRTVTDGFGEGPVHAVWYCVAVTNEHVQDVDVETLRRLGEEPEIRRRVLLVLTKCDEDTETSDKAKALSQALFSALGYGLPAFEVSSIPDFPLELPDLIEQSADLFDDEDLRRNFLAAQMADIDAKRAAAQQIVTAASAAAAFIGGIPLPVPDSALLMPTQVAMVTKIVDLYGLRRLAAFSQALAGNVLISQVGRSLAAGLLKLVPVIGPWVGGVFDATVAAALTYAIGTAASEVCAGSTRRALQGEPVHWSELFASPEFVETVETLFAARLNR